MHKYFSSIVTILLSSLFIVSGCTKILQTTESIDFEALYGPSKPKQRLLLAGTKQAMGEISYHKQIKPILDSRCVACHACYDAPCQLKLGSTAGVDRGATKQLVYDGARLNDVAPTRLFIDATSTEGWREKEFYPVLNERMDSAQAALNNSLLAKLLQLKRDNPLPESGKLADSFKLDINRTLECPTVSEFDSYQEKHPDWGMPYAMPGLTLKQEYMIMQWLQQGAKFDQAPSISNALLKAINQWEQFFNGTSLKQQLVSRYIYEHLFIGHIHFKDFPEDRFFRLVRSTTPSGQPINEIATALPYDDPGVSEFYYRLRPVNETIVDKTHLVYQLNFEKMRRYKALFFKPDYSVDKLPTYQDAIAANPFKAFLAIPKASRYQFLLDDAQYFVSGFIKGPVCRGQVALNVIRDRFWVVFLTPDGSKIESNKATKINQFLSQQSNILSLPGTAGNRLGLFGYKKYTELAEQYLKNKDIFANQLIEEYGGFQMDDIWDGNGINQNAALTVFRHSNSATVVKGLVGDTPLTAWIVDYALFERIHYLLVAGFNVYSSIDHQLASRTYMDFLRMDGENNFLRLMPADQRKKIHASWYKGISGKIVNYLETPYYSAGYPTGMKYHTSDYKQEFFAQLRQHLGKAVNEQDNLNQCNDNACVRKGTTVFQQEVNNTMRALTKLRGPELDVLPEMSLLKVRGPEGQVQVYTLLLNKTLDNVAIMFAEDLRREPELDTVTVVPGFLGSYPNMFFSVEKQELAEFIIALRSANSEADKDTFYSKYAIRRTNPKIWEYADWFNAQHKKSRGIRAGLFDLSRYHNL